MAETNPSWITGRSLIVTQPPLRWLSSIASQSATSRWPSANVANGAGAEKSPVAT